MSGECLRDGGGGACLLVGTPMEGGVGLSGYLAC